MDLLTLLQREFREFRQQAEARIKSLERSLRIIPPEPVFVPEPAATDPAVAATTVAVATMPATPAETPAETPSATPPVEEVAAGTAGPATDPVTDPAAGADDTSADNKPKAGKGKTADQAADQTDAAK
ncbi:hypothetical protein [Mesorhizobium sp. M0491]|uniref:hypothetical protein n=1 Tax=Mesorhizobium sp. M0491 TaxID=2956950 RepID=UPI0033395626